MSESRENAKKLLKLFGPEGEHWTKGWFAYTKTGKATYATSKHAVSWCLHGGCRKLGIFDRQFLYVHVDNIARFNDRDGFAPVKKLLEKIAGGK